MILAQKEAYSLSHGEPIRENRTKGEEKTITIVFFC